MNDSPIIITLSHQKGGVGKSTLAFNLAAYFQKQGDACAVVDSDLQGTITEIYNNFSEDKETLAGVKLIRRDASRRNSTISTPFLILCWYPPSRT